MDKLKKELRLLISMYLVSWAFNIMPESETKREFAIFLISISK